MPDANVKLAKKIYEGFGEEALSIYEDIGRSGAGMLYTVAGISLARGNEVAANMIFQGAEALKGDSDYFKGMEVDLNRAASEQLGRI